MGNIKNSKKWVAPILMFVFCEFIFRQRISKKIFYDDLLVFNFFDNTVVNKYFSLGLSCFVVTCIILLQTWQRFLAKKDAGPLAARPGA